MAFTYEREIPVEIVATPVDGASCFSPVADVARNWDTVEVSQTAPVGAVEQHGVTDGAVDARGRRHAAREVLTRLLILFGDAAHESLPVGVGIVWAGRCSRR